MNIQGKVWGKIKLLNPTELYTVEELEKIEIDG
jgi:hypothetical protein